MKLLMFRSVNLDSDGRVVRGVIFCIKDGRRASPHSPGSSMTTAQRDAMESSKATADDAISADVILLHLGLRRSSALQTPHPSRRDQQPQPLLPSAISLASRPLLLGVSPAATIGGDAPKGLCLHVKLMATSRRGAILLWGEGGVARAEHAHSDLEGGGI